jgi:phosphoglycerate-specific signal transduction histidine kinase
MNSDTQLVLVFSFLEDIAREQLIDQANVANPAERTNVRENMRQALEEVRSMITQLEQSNPSVTAIITKDNAERLVTVLDARVLCHVTEAMIVADCYQDYSAAADAMTRAVQRCRRTRGCAHRLRTIICLQAI